jgi:hypothetical protein
VQEALALYSTLEDEYVKERHNKVISRGKVKLFMPGSIKATAMVHGFEEAKGW